VGGGTLFWHNDELGFLGRTISAIQDFWCGRGDRHGWSSGMFRLRLQNMLLSDDVHYSTRLHGLGEEWPFASLAAYCKCGRMSITDQHICVHYDWSAAREDLCFEPAAAMGHHGLSMQLASPNRCSHRCSNHFLNRGKQRISESANHVSAASH
jgi:hypothetical protein